MLKKLLVPVLFLVASAAAPSKAQEPPRSIQSGQMGEVDPLRLEIDRLRKRLDQVEAAPRRAAVIIPDAVGCPKKSTEGQCDLEARARGICAVIGYPKARRIYQVDVPSAEAPVIRQLYHVACFD